MIMVMHIQTQSPLRYLEQKTRAQDLHQRHANNAARSRLGTLIQCMLTINNTSHFSYTRALIHKKHGYHHHHHHHHHHHNIDTHKSSYTQRQLDTMFKRLHDDLAHLAEAQAKHKADKRKIEQNNNIMQSQPRFYGKLAHIVTRVAPVTDQKSNQMIADQTTSIQTRYSPSTTTQTDTAPVKETIIQTIILTKISNSDNVSQLDRKKLPVSDINSKHDITSPAILKNPFIPLAESRTDALSAKNQENTPPFNDRPDSVYHKLNNRVADIKPDLVSQSSEKTDKQAFRLSAASTDNDQRLELPVFSRPC